MADDIRELVGRCRSGSEDAATELVQRYYGLVFSLCYRMLGNHHDAEDVAQESLVRALKSLDHYDVERDFRPWLLAIAGNRCRSFAQVRNRRPRVTDDFSQFEDPRHKEHEARPMLEEVSVALARLREEYRQAFLLFHTEHLSYAEIASALVCPIGTVRTWVHRARKEIAAHLARRGVITGFAQCNVKTLKED